ncbi:hypothetical protein PCI56_22660 [Plesiomonas shigelloides subsp. oncorhynchi]|nr:hypothetical protein [Plesiomonas shigelloides]
MMLSRAPDMDNAALLAAANTVRSQGNQQVILCETGASAPQKVHRVGIWSPPHSCANRQTCRS